MVGGVSGLNLVSDSIKEKSRYVGLKGIYSLKGPDRISLLDLRCVVAFDIDIKIVGINLL